MKYNNTTMKYNHPYKVYITSEKQTKRKNIFYNLKTYSLHSLKYTF